MKQIFNVNGSSRIQWHLMTHLCLQLYLYIHTVHPFMWISTSLCNFSLQGGWLKLIFFLAYLANVSMISTGYTVSFVPFCSPWLRQTFAPVLPGVLRCSPGFGWKLQCWVCSQFEACWGIQQILKINSVAPAATLGWVAPVSLFFFGGLETSQQQKGSFGFQVFFYGVQYRRQVGDVDVDSLTFSSMATEVWICTAGSESDSAGDHWCPKNVGRPSWWLAFSEGEYNPSHVRGVSDSVV